MKKLSAKDFQASIEAIGAELRQAIELACEAFPADKAASARRRAAALDLDTGFGVFRRTYFPHYHDKPDSKLHTALEAALPAIARDPAGRRECVVAARGSAKSTCCSLEYVLWLILTGLKRFPILISDSSAQAELLLDAIKAEVEINPRLKYDFPELSPGRVWRADAVTIGKARVEALGRGKKIRGRRHGPHRPDLVILDDVEDDEMVQSPDQRDKLERWLDNAVLKSGPPDGTMDCLFVGTILHFDAVLTRKARKPAWRVTRFDAVLAWPDRMDLWETFAELVQNADDDGYVEARAYHAAHRAEMEAGGEVVWPAMQPLLELMVEWAEDRDAFMSERQNDPIARNSLFRDFVYWVQERTDLITFGAVDPSLGKRGHGRDPSAIIIGGYDRQSGVLDVLEASIRRRLPDTIIDDVIAMQRRWRCQLMFVEAVQFQEFLRTTLMQRAVKAGVALPTIPISPITDKELRIERIQPAIAGGLIRLHQSQIQLIDQLRQYPNAAHDDGPDALEMLWTNAVHHAGSMLTSGLKVAGVRVSNQTMRGYRL